MSGKLPYWSMGIRSIPARIEIYLFYVVAIGKTRDIYVFQFLQHSGCLVYCILDLALLQENERDLYVREASVLVYGDSKHFEEERYEAVCGIIREALGKPAAEAEAYDEILQLYHISNVEQERYHFPSISTAHS